MRYKLSFLSAFVILMGCSSFREGQFYAYSPNHLSSVKYFFFSDGKYENHSVTKEGEKLWEKGKWKKKDNGTIIVNVDSIFVNGRGDTADILLEYKRRFLNRDELVIKQQINGKSVKVILKPL